MQKRKGDMPNYRMKAIGGAIVAGCLLFAFLAQAADKIILKNGKVYEGRILGKSDRRYLFALDTGGTTMQLSFFLDDVDKVELDKQTVDRQIPYLKEVESLKVPVSEGNETVYEMSMYKKGQLEGDQQFFTMAEIKEILTKEEFDYYKKFLDITTRYADRLIAIDNLYQNLPTATRDDFANARQSLDLVYSELNALTVPPLFKQGHEAYLAYLKATYMVFGALERGLLDEASSQMKAAEQAKQQSLMSFRQVIMQKKNKALPQKTPEGTAPQKP
ncbi:hypothetical protein BU251_08270 [Candidatus Velamenicoccus archaeovorus]|uniref:Uncharacterized protein n=2 Tax=Velamenicoccus archaeovorus TaxID=1930593 RepID=A0A410P6Y5_VELA1|nr:hypothetical protein BU251_08270 [Candidatus Velamenicoccus archaeovorus]